MGRVISFTYKPFYRQVMNPRYQGLGGPQRWSGHFVEEKNLLSLPGIEPRFLVRPARNLVTVPTMLFAADLNWTQKGAPFNMELTSQFVD